ncbi:hypothetical protein F4810DRAFT_440833 [Camillea tinctor]|nr:hypothetical protein F4810DRAFT_440833 [Camillea tinctor]
MEFAYSLAMYAPPDMYRKPPRKPSEAPSQLSTTKTGTITTTTTTTAGTTSTTTTTAATTNNLNSAEHNHKHHNHHHHYNHTSPRTITSRTTNNDDDENEDQDQDQDQDEEEDEDDDYDTNSNSTTKNNYSTSTRTSTSASTSATATARASVGVNPNSSNPPPSSLPTAFTDPTTTTSSSSSSRPDHSVRRFRRSSRRRAASATTATTSTTSHHLPTNALANVAAAIDSSRHSRTSSSSGASSRTSHEAAPPRSLLQAFRPSSSKRHTTGSEITHTPAPLTTTGSAGTTVASPPPASTTHSASASQPESLAASLKSPKQIRPGPLHFFRRRDSHQRKPDPSQLSPTPTSPPIYAQTGSPSSSRPSRLNESRYQHDISGSFAPLSKYYSPSSRYDSVSSASVTASSLITSVMSSHEHLPVVAGGSASVSTASASSSSKAPSVGPKPLVTRNNRTYIHEPTLAYPLPVDLSELHRQSLRTLLLFQLFGGPIISGAFANKPPSRVLEVGCGSAFWSMMCHRYFAQHGHASISFTGIDIVPLAGAGLDPNIKPDKDMRWQFVQHDIRRLPCPFPDEEFDLIMVKDMSLSVSYRDNQPMFEEYVRMLKPGGVVEVWETDHTIRMLRPNVLKAPKPSRASSDSDSSSDDDDDEDTNVERLGAYCMTTNTPLSTPLNPFLVEYNAWATKALELRGLSAVPCTLIGPHILQESEILTDVRSKRLAVPLSEIRWEREGVGGVVTKDGKSYIDSMKGKSRPSDIKGAKPGAKALTPGQAALRRTALESTVGLILSLEPLLREASGKSQDEWDSWTGKMTNDLLRDGGTNCGECLEVGAWTARKRSRKT